MATALPRGVPSFPRMVLASFLVHLVILPLLLLEISFPPRIRTGPAILEVEMVELTPPKAPVVRPRPAPKAQKTVRRPPKPKTTPKVQAVAKPKPKPKPKPETLVQPKPKSEALPAPPKKAEPPSPQPPVPKAPPDSQKTVPVQAPVPPSLSAPQEAPKPEAPPTALARTQVPTTPPPVVTVEGADFVFLYYLNHIQSRVEQHWRQPVGRGSRVAVITFWINRRGEVTDLRVERSSGDPFFDRAALRAVQKASPFLPLPRGYLGEGLRVHYRFVFGEETG